VVEEAKYPDDVRSLKQMLLPSLVVTLVSVEVPKPPATPALHVELRELPFSPIFIRGQIFTLSLYVQADFEGIIQISAAISSKKLVWKHPSNQPNHYTLESTAGSGERWRRFEWHFKIPSKIESELKSRVRFDFKLLSPVSSQGSPMVLHLACPQLEPKAFATPYSNGFRPGSFILFFSSKP